MTHQSAPTTGKTPSGFKTDGLDKSGASRVEPVVLDVVEGPAQGDRRELNEGTVSVGSQSGCDWVVADSAISRRHASFELHAGGVRVKDLGSRNGVRYLGARITDALVPVGGAIQLGRTIVRVRPRRADPVADEELAQLGDVLAFSLPMRRVLAQAKRVAATQGGVVLQGESGVGKGELARAIHLASPRAKAPFVLFECAGANAETVESELFGHMRGAFTGAHQNRVGLLEAARGGTLVLDEVGDLPLALQPKLLRVLESGEYRALGATNDQIADVRVIACSQKQLEQEVRERRFRADLYFRLTSVIIEIPPLRARPEDIIPLAHHFVRQLGSDDFKLTAGTVAALQCDAWPGNVRELKNAVERVCRLGSPVAAAQAVVDPTAPELFSAARAKVLDSFERDYLSALLERHRGKIAPAAKAAGVSRSQMYRLLERHGLHERVDSK